MKAKAGIIIMLVSILLAGLIAFSGCKSKKPTPTKPARPAAKAVEPNKPK